MNIGSSFRRVHADSPVKEISTKTFGDGPKHLETALNVRGNKGAGTLTFNINNAYELALHHVRDGQRYMAILNMAQTYGHPDTYK